MKKFKVHLILLSDQVTPNIIPVLDKNIMPEKVILCESDAMQRKGKAAILKVFFKTKGIQTEHISLGSAYNFEELQNVFTKITNNYSPEELAINLTGGTKLMSIAAQNVFTMYDNYTCFYVVPNEDKLVEFHAGQDKVSEYKLKDQIKINDYFKIHGYQIIHKNTGKNFKITPASSELATELLKNLNLYHESISKLNGLATNAANAFSLKIRANILPADEPLFELFSKKGFIQYFDDQEVQFKDEKSREFCRGIWLEEYIFNELRQLDQLQDFATSVNIKSQEGNENEFDAVFLYKNNPYIIEAKTSKAAENGKEIIYKLDSLKAKTGLYTKPIIVSLKQFTTADRNRATQYGIKLIEGHNINNLKDKIKEIIN